MILQPFVENAIWHGLRYREEGGQVTVAVERNNGKIMVTITDNGIGRKRSAALKTKNQLNHQSTGLETTLQRLELINTYYGEAFAAKIRDAYPEEEHVGTRVEIMLVQ